MATTCATVDNNGTATDGTSINTASINLLSDRLYFMMTGSRNASDPAAPTITGWTAVPGGSVLQPGTNQRTTVFSRVGDGSTGVHTISWGAVSQFDMHYAVCLWGEDVDESSFLVQVKTGYGTGTAPGVTFDSAFDDATNNATYFGALHRKDENQSADSPLTLLDNKFANMSLATSWDLGEDASPSHTAIGSENWTAVGIEVAAAAASGLPIPIAQRHYLDMGNN